MRTANIRLLTIAALVVVTAGSRGLAVDAQGEKAPAASIKGQVLYGKQPAAKIRISLDGPAKAVATSDAKGEFVFNDLPSGEYKLEAQGTAKNYIRKGSAKVTVLDSAKEPSAVTIKLN